MMTLMMRRIVGGFRHKLTFAAVNRLFVAAKCTSVAAASLFFASGNVHFAART